MNAKTPHIPKYRRQTDKTGARAFVEVNRRRIYFGRFGSPESKAAYGRFVAEYVATGGVPPVDPNLITVAEVCDRFLTHLREYHAASNDPAKEPAQYKLAMRELLAVYADEPAGEFNQLGLKAVRVRLVERGLSRVYINRCTKRIRRIFRWAASEGLIGVEVWHKLQTVEGLRRGHTSAPETQPVRPVDDAIVDATLEHCTPTLKAMIQLQRLTGMRPGELCIMRSGDVDVSSKAWTYTPDRHKTEHHGHTRRIFIGPRGQDILRPLLKADLQAFVFSPRQSEAERRDAMHKARKTPVSCGNVPGSNRVEKPRKRPGKRYSTQSYGRAIRNACRRAFPAPDGLDADAVTQWHRNHTWSPNQLRHAFATEIRRDHGVDLAGTLLGHAPGSTITATYAERSEGLAAEIAAKVG